MLHFQNTLYLYGITDREGVRVGILLISSVLSLQTLWDPISANQLPSLTFLPTYTATGERRNRLFSSVEYCC